MSERIMARTAAAASAASATETRIRVLERELDVLRNASDEETAALEHGNSGGDDDDCVLPPSIVNMDPLVQVPPHRVLHERRVVRHGAVETSRVIVGPHWIGVVVTLALILGATGAFLRQQCVMLPWRFTVATLAFCIATLYFLFETACRDPGIVYPQGHYSDNDGVSCADTDSRADQVELLGQPDELRRRTRQRICDVCGVDQAPRTEHCDDCDVCIAELDHHCPWMGKCIGKRNLRAFQCFNAAWVLYVVFVLGVSLTSADWSAMAIEQLDRATTNSSWGSHVASPPHHRP